MSNASTAACQVLTLLSLPTSHVRAAGNLPPTGRDVFLSYLWEGWLHESFTKSMHLSTAYTSHVTMTTVSTNATRLSQPEHNDSTLFSTLSGVRDRYGFIKTYLTLLGQHQWPCRVPCKLRDGQYQHSPTVDALTVIGTSIAPRSYKTPIIWSLILSLGNYRLS